MDIRRLDQGEPLPLELLLLADPSEQLVLDYTARGQCYIGIVPGEMEEIPGDTDVMTGEIAGVYVLLPTRPETVELVNVAVSEQFQGRGYGKSLVQDAVKRAREQHYKTIEVGTANSSINQLALYQKCGFRLSGIDKDFFLRHYAEEIFENGLQALDMIRMTQDL